MPTPLVVNGNTYQYPNTKDNNWGPDATAWAVAITNGTLQNAGGTFTLTADVDFGANFGLKSLYYKSRSSTPSTTGVVRLGNTEIIGWRNAANNANLPLTVNASDALQFNSITLADISSTQTFTNKTLTSPTIGTPTFTGQSVFPSGSAGSPSIGIGGTGSGWYSSAASTISASASGGLVMTIDSNKIFASIPFQVSDGTVVAQAYGFNSAAGGMYSPGTNQIAFATNGVQVMTMGASHTTGFSGVSISPAVVQVGQGGVNVLTGTGQYSYRTDLQANSAATGSVYGFYGRTRTADVSFTTPVLAQFTAQDVGKGPSSTITRYLSFFGGGEASGDNNATLADNLAFTGNYFLHSNATIDSLISGQFKINTAGKGLSVKEGSNAKSGTFTVNGTTAVVISNTSITSSSRIFLTAQVSGGTPGALYVSAISAGTSFSIKSTSGSDTSTGAYFIVEAL